MNNMDPKDQKNKFCIYCGKKIPINAKKCSYCFEWLDDELSSEMPYSNQDDSIAKFGENKTKNDNYLVNQNYNRNTNVSSPTYINTGEYSKVLPIRRLYLLLILTFGLYGIFWFYKNNSYLRDQLGKDISVGLRTLAFAIIPIANIIVFYELLNDMKEVIEEKGLESYSPGINTLIYLFIPFIGMWVYINVQESFNEFWRIHEPQLPVKRDFGNGEILVMIFTAIVIPVLIFLFLLVLIYILSYPNYY